jgi:pimeloyl-ACP methyl ester carboxylesterase
MRINLLTCLVSLLFFDSILLFIPQYAYAAIIFSDDFNRPDSNTLGSDWVELYGSLPAGISNNRGYITTGAGGLWGFYGVKGLNTQDAIIKATVTNSGCNNGVFARYKDIKNRVIADFGDPSHNCNQVEFGYFYQGNSHYFWPSFPVGVKGQTYEFELTVQGDKMSLKIDGQLIDTEIMDAVWSGTAGIYAQDGYTNVMFDNFSVTDDTLSNTPSPTPTPTSTPTPTPIPVTKTVLIPGLGASWNLNAFANCEFDNNPENWSLAPYATDIYQPLKDSITNNHWNLKEFNYDWRDIVENNSIELSDTINSFAPATDEQVNIIGHSMGGLVAMGYTLEHPEKVAKILTAGTPFQGAVQAYPAWEGGEIWQDNFITKIAETLYLKHCGLIHGSKSDSQTIQENIPSTENLLPTFGYLSRIKTGQSIDPKDASNTWPHIDFSVPSGVEFETLTGSGFNTLSGIQLKEINRHEQNTGVWEDGKPGGKLYSTDGDGTVLLNSSQIEGVPNSILENVSHSGLVNSEEGISEILSFLGSGPQSLISNNIEPTSALVVIGYPANFIVTDQNGITKNAEHGMISFTNPKSGNYMLRLLPQSNNTTLIVAQFLSNREVKYKEYNLKGLGPKYKTLKYDPQNPQEDILVN